MRLYFPLSLPVLLAASACGGNAPSSIAIDYPADGSLFPPEITAPTFLWRDSSAAASWRIDVSFADGAPGIRATARGERMRTGEIDPRCVSDTNEPPALTPEQASARTWVPDRALWESLKRRSVSGPATVTITGFRGGADAVPVSRGSVTIRTSKDPVGAPIFYRDVPLMPTETEKGVIKPLAAEAVRLIAWRLRDLSQPRSRVLLDNMPVCANCHSFSSDGKTMGMDLDGLHNNKGMYTLTPVAAETSVRDENLIQWRNAAGRLKGEIRVGFMSQVSPDGRHVVTTIDTPGRKDSGTNYYVVNFKDYRFLQVFYPTRGILAWYSRETGILQPLPGADDPRFVQMCAVWSPDGTYLVFARAEARDPNPPGLAPARFANDPNERQIQYDLYRIPFHDGKGGTPEPIAGASRNGMSNTFPKVSPDGRWIVFVQCRNGQLMRPDSQLYIVPAGGGQARRLRANLALMNSWHSFSPNGRWLVFSSKARSPYTQMYLTHIDEEGNDSPAILVENTTAANRAVNIPEFVNVAPEAFGKIGGPAIEYYRLVDRAVYFQKREAFAEAAAKWREVLEVRPDDLMAHNGLASALLRTGHRDEAAAEFQKATEIRLRQAAEADPAHPGPRNQLGLMLLETGRPDEAIREFRKAVDLGPALARSRTNLARALAASGKPEEALVHLRKALQLDPKYAPSRYTLGVVLSGRGETAEAMRQWRLALNLDPKYAAAHASMASALYLQGRVAEALAEWREAIRLQPNDAAALERAARVLATCPDPAVRNGREAVALAVKAVQLSGGNNPDILDTLAAAYAEAGRFADAAATERRALASNTRPELGAAIQRRIVLYDSGAPLRETPPTR